MGPEGFNFRHGAASHRRQGFHIHDLITIAHASQTLDTPVHLRLNQRTEILLRKDPFEFLKSAGRRGIFMGKVLKIAAPALIADGTIQRVIGQNEIQHRFAGALHHRGRSRFHHHALRHLGTTGGLQPGHFFNFH